MSLAFYGIPLHHGQNVQEELNRALRSLRVVSVEKHFCPNPGEPGWAVCVEHAEATGTASQGKGMGGRAVDYREVLDPQSFTIFAALRKLRKDIASQEAVPVYTIMTNEQLAALAQRRCQSLEELKTVDGLGEARARKYGPPFLEAIRQGLVQADSDASSAASHQATGGAPAGRKEPF